MLDFFSIFSKGGILLWCFKVNYFSSYARVLTCNVKGAGLLAREWEAFTPTVNDLIRSVLLQVMTAHVPTL